MLERINIKTMEGESHIDLSFDSIVTFDKKINPEIHVRQKSFIKK
jgi:hypothetical protein